MVEHCSADEVVETVKDNWPEVHSNTHELLIYLNRVRDLGFAQARGVMTQYNLSNGEFDVLATLRRIAPPNVLTPTELQRSVLVTSGGLTKLLHQLEARGLVSRSVQKQDKRSKLVHLTAKGKKTIERAMVAVMKVEDRWLGEALSGGELEKLKQLLGEAARAVESRAADMSPSVAHG